MTGRALDRRRYLSMLPWIAAIGSALPLPALAQPAPGQHRIAFINVGPAAVNVKNLAALRAGLAEFGYVEGRNLTLDLRWAEQRGDRLPSLIDELLALRPQLVISTGGAATARAVKAATATLPVVFITGDPVNENLVASLARPGANLTGLAVLAGELEAKRLELLAQMLPRARRIALIWNPTQPSVQAIFESVEAAGKRLGLSLLPWKARNPGELDAAFAEIARAKFDALFVIADPVLGFERARIVEFAAAQQLPGIYFWREFAEAGGLASYGTSLPAVYKRSAYYVDRILKGASPAELPIEQPTTFELVVNLRTARALGITLPGAVRLRVDEWIE